MRQDVLDVQDLGAKAEIRDQPVTIVRDIENGPVANHVGVMELRFHISVGSPRGRPHGTHPVR